MPVTGRLHLSSCMLWKRILEVHVCPLLHNPKEPDRRDDSSPHLGKQSQKVLVQRLSHLMNLSQVVLEGASRTEEHFREGFLRHYLRQGPGFDPFSG